MSFTKFKINESNIWQGQLNKIKVNFRPSIVIPANTTIYIKNVKNSSTSSESIIISEITNNLLNPEAIWDQNEGNLSVTTNNDIPIDKDTSFTFTITNNQEASYTRGGYFTDISSNNLLLKSSNKIMSCDISKNVDPSANYFLWFNYGGIVTGPYSEEYAPIGTEGTYQGTTYGKDISRNSNYYFNNGHQSTNWKDIYSSESHAMPNLYTNLVIGDMQYEQVFLKDLDTLGAIYVAENNYIDTSKNQGFFSGTTAYRKIKSDDVYSNYGNRRGTRLNGDDPDRNTNKIFTNDSYDNSNVFANSNDTGSLGQSTEFNKEYFIESGPGSLLEKNGQYFTLHANVDLSRAKYKTDSTLGSEYDGKTLEEKDELISFKFTQNRHPPIWDRDNIKFNIKEIKESNNAQEAFNTIYVRLRPNRNLTGNSKIIITDLSGTLTPNNENLDISGTKIFIGDSGKWVKDLSNGTLKLEIEQSKIMSKNSITEFSFILINRNEGQDKIQPKIKVEKIGKTIVEENMMYSGDGILDASMNMVYMVDISNNKYRLRNVKNNVFENELDFILLDEKYKVKFDFTDTSITDFENQRFKFDLSGPNLRGPLDDTLVKVYADYVILDISKNSQGRTTELNKGLSGEDIIIFYSSNNTVDNSGVIFINEPVFINTEGDYNEMKGSVNAKVVLKEAYLVPENIKKRFVAAPVTKEDKRKNNLLRHRTIKNIFKTMPKEIQVFKTTPVEIGITNIAFKKPKVKVFKIKAAEKKVSIVVSEETDNDTGFYVPLSSGETVSFQKDANSTEFDIVRTDVDGEARYTTTGVVRQTSGNYTTLNYFLDDDIAVIHNISLYFGGVSENGTVEETINKCIELTNCCSCDEKPIKIDESTLTENNSNTSRKMTWARLSAFNRKSSGRAAGSSVKKCEIFNFNIPRLTECQKQRSWDPKNKRWVLQKY